MMRNADGKLPVLTDSATGGCGCDRRTVLGGLAVGALVVGCRIDDPGAGDDVPTDGPAPDGVAGTGFAECGTNMVCVDLVHPLNVNLLAAGGSRVIQQGTKKILIARVDDTTFNTTSAICTHAGCTVRYAAAASQLQCPCHGSKYELNGTLVVGAVSGQNDLASFDNDFDMATSVLTIMLV
jgi:nitrite reductase/ring-hydroxylating ferredoxin subunit